MNIKVNLTRTVFLGFILLALGCFDSQTRSYSILDKNILAIEANLKKAGHGVFEFSSRGGSTRVALKLGEKIKDAGVTLVVNNECSSNCAEIILPFSKKVIFEQNPIIEFHGNIQSYSHYVENDAIKDKEHCNWLYKRQLEKLLTQKNLNLNFWKEQMKRLEPDVSFEYIYRTCPKRHYNFKNNYWLPTSAQLRELWGLEFDGTVCADFPKDCKKRIDYRWMKGTRVVIGDEVYTSRGVRMFRTPYPKND